METLDGIPYWAYGGDIEPAATDTSMSFSANGLVYADRTPYPYLWEVKKVQQNIGFEVENIKNGVVNIVNKNFFISLDGKSLSWNITANGLKIKEGGLIELSAKPQQLERVQLDYQLDFKDGVEYFLNLEVKNKHANGVLASSHVVAWSQHAFPYVKPSTKNISKEVLITLEKSKYIKFSGNDFKAKIDKQTGLFSSLIFNNTELLKASPRPSFWRAPTDNDLPIKDYNSGLPAWQKAGKNMSLTNLSVTKVSKYQTRVELEHDLKSIGSRYFTTYNIFGNGEIKVDVSFYAAPHKRQSSLPRIGTLFQLDKQLSNVTWFGRGPHENYWDRKDSAHVGLYSNTVEGLYVPYVRPQENGFRSDVRFVAFHNKEGKGVLFEGDPLIGFGAQYYSTDEYDSNNDDVTSREMHPHNLTKKDKIFVNIDYRQRGVGGTNSWGEKPLFDYTLPWLDYKYSYTIKPFTTKK
jgi:beta-galactosidase